ncbi:GNAT family N-acetyltransferase [Sutcliffiella rhizosphaerae]|uniref:N-acetyltransferase domain-containing protein n=1 Tax=Sutcliffiella rhizosphaerae TaxID=2880967 RepID=A0ABM8YTP3_9BACI|nr:GNAT family protein [Sutcliffiella rhizosphaerae]CAG9623335.1 hypothetical protein BACCIP111883_04136 [Sutcliffiella rhizosphaerae]
MKNYIFRMMDDREAKQIANWQYEAPYSFYNFKNDVEDLNELLDSSLRGNSYFSVYDQTEELIGFFCFYQKENAIEIGLGLRPNYTGMGLGLEFLNAGLRFAISHFDSPEEIILAVATFNKRAIQLYERVGFIITGTEIIATNGAEYEFYRMSKKIIS